MNTRLSKEDSSAIEWLRFPLIVCVVLIHSYGTPVDLSNADWTALSGNDVYNIIRVFFSQIVTRMAVPCFYVISGYLFFRNVEEFNGSVYKAKMKTRLRTLLLPYILWNAIFIFAIVGKDLLKLLLGMGSFDDIIQWYDEKGGLFGLFWNCSTLNKDRIDWLGNPLRQTFPADLPFWYLRDLIVVTALTPAIYWLVKRGRLWYIGLLCLAYISQVWPQIDGFSVTAMFFFSVGAYMGVHKTSVTAIKKWSTPIYIITAILAIIYTYLGGLETSIGYLLYPFFCIAGTAAAFCIAARCHGKGHTRWPILTRSVFFIYALHGLYIVSYYCGGILHKLAEGHGALVMTLAYFAAPALKIAVCIAIFAFMERFMPRLLAVLTGKRS